MILPLLCLSWSPREFVVYKYILTAYFIYLENSFFGINKKKCLRKTVCIFGSCLQDEIIIIYIKNSRVLIEATPQREVI